MINVRPSNITEWFESYTAYITAFASFAESLEVEILSVALELILISGTKLKLQIDSIITSYRAVH